MTAEDKILRDEKGSFLQFGLFDASCYYDIEGSADRGKQQKIKSVEFVLEREGKVIFVEAKKTAPNITVPDVLRLRDYIKPECEKDFDEFISHREIQPVFFSDVSVKFAASLMLAMQITYGYIQSNEMPQSIKDALLKKETDIVFVLVVTDCKPDWVENITRKLQTEIRKILVSQHIKVLVLTAEMALQKDLVYQIYPHPWQVC